MIERRGEPRLHSKVHVLVWGTDAHGDSFSEDANLANISLSGALLSGLKHQPRCGDLIGVAYEGQKARFRAIWVRPSDDEEMIQVAVEKLPQYACPWGSLLSGGTRSGTRTEPVPAVVTEQCKP